ncbi:MAG: heat-inducible transcription repressor HrcA [Chloroflexi bacterium]|nr:heat-inducible transcription repressor HrcA [Chloroflexota bacterium]
MDLSIRQKTILGLVVRGYTSSAVPVGSEALAGQPGIEVSPATVRHEMAVLEGVGLLTHPHPSAGRVPTEQGYRFFVEHLMAEEELSSQEKRTIRHQFHQSPWEVEEWLRLACAVLAQSTHNAALATPPKSPRPRLKHLELLPLGEEGDLLVMVMQEGMIRQEMISPPSGLSRWELNQISQELSAHLQDRVPDEIEGLLASWEGTKRSVAARVAESLRDLSGKGTPELFHEGLLNILRLPEFSVSERIEQTLWLLEEAALEPILAEVELSPGSVEVLIAGEGRWPQIQDYALVLAPYQMADSVLGTLGILGPLRMPYQRTVPAVRYISQLVSDMLTATSTPGY